MGLLANLTRSAHIHSQVGRLFRDHLPTGRILDIPAGNGVNARHLQEDGFAVECADLFPEKAEAGGLRCTRCDMTQPLPYEGESFDGVLHSEGIEHVDNQVELLGELARILKPGGVLVVTTPNTLFLSARVDNLFTGHPRSSRWLVNELHGYWGGTTQSSDSTYFGHVFLINAFQLRFYLLHVGLEVVGIETTRYSLPSVLLAPLLYPLAWWSTKRMWRRQRSRAPAELRATIDAMALSPDLLLGKKLIMIARKPGGPSSSSPGAERLAGCEAAAPSGSLGGT